MGNKEQAIHILSDEILNLKLNLERAESVLNEVAEYFSEYDNKTEDGRFGILYGYNRQRIFTDIVSDYLFYMRETLNILSEN